MKQKSDTDLIQNDLLTTLPWSLGEMYIYGIFPVKSRMA